MKKIIQEAEQHQGVQLMLSIPQLLSQSLHSLVVDAGMTVLQQLLENERAQLCGARYDHQPDRVASRGGHAPGELSLGGRRVSVRRPRVRSQDGKEIRLTTWDAMASNDPLNKRAVEQMVVGVSTRKYRRSLEEVSVKTRGASKSAVSRRFVAMTQQHLVKMLNADIGKLGIEVLMMDGIVINKHVVIVAIGIDGDGQKHVLGLHEGATENATSCTALLTNLVSRGLRSDRSILVVIDGSMALRKAVKDVFGERAIVQRCQVHKVRNVTGHLPEKMGPTITTALKQAYRGTDLDRSTKQLNNLARNLEREHPSAAESIREGLEETLTIKRFKLSKSFEQLLSTTNAIENVQSGIRRICHRVTTWNGGNMILRWVAQALQEHGRGFRRLKGHKEMKKVVAFLRKHDAIALGQQAA